jgi:hypothetical protein
MYSMTTAAEAHTHAWQRWTGWTRLSLDGLRVPYWAAALALGALVFAGQIAERTQIGPLSDLFAPRVLTFRLGLPVLTVYMLLALKTLKTSALPKLADIRSSVQIDDDAFDRHVQQMLSISPRAEAILAGASLAVTLVWFFVLGLPPALTPNAVLPDNFLKALLILASYTIFGWAGLALLYSSLRFGRGLGALAECPLAVNVFDPDDLLGFGMLSLRHSVTVAGAILLLFLMLGAPSQLAEYMVVLLTSLGSLSALVIPLWGVHKQMTAGRDRASSRIGLELAECQAHLLSVARIDPATLAELTDRTSKLMALRALIYKSPTWPFRDVSQLVRVVLAAMSPFLIFIINEIMRTYLLPVLGLR